jgi:hypothetical protein
LLSIQGTSPRIASLFATQQRWLMAHAALAQYFRNEADSVGAGLLAERFLERAERHGLASRNTASAFLTEMLKYEMVRQQRGQAPPAIRARAGGVDGPVPLARAASCDA